MKIFDLFLILIVFCLSHNVFADGIYQVAQINAATFYVSPAGNDNNPGTKESPFRTIQKAVNQSNAGTTIYVREGTYHEQVSIHDKKGVPPAPVKLLAYPGETPVIDGEDKLPVDQWQGLIDIRRSDYIEINGFTITKVKGRGIYAVNGSNIMILNNDINYVLRHAMNIRTSHSLIENNKVWEAARFNAPSDSHKPGDRGMWPGSLMVDRTHNVIVRGNEVYQNWGEGIICLISDSTIIENNIVWNNWAIGIYLDNSRWSRVRNNMVYWDNDKAYWRRAERPGVAIQIGNEVYSDNPNARGINQEITNNFVLSAGIGFAFHNFETEDNRLTDVLIANNTFVDTYNPAIDIGNTKPGYKHSNVRITNNIAIKSSSSLVSTGTMEGLTFSHNLWSHSVSTQFRSSDDVVDDPKLARTGSAKGGELSPDYFKLHNNSPAINKGLPLTEVTEDFFGTPRSGTPDIGGYEFDPTASTNQHGLSPVNDGFEIFPNPNSTGLLLLSRTMDFAIYSLSGKEVLRSIDTCIVNISELKNGIYIISDFNGSSRKLIIL
jgi:parallel beta-helix repeat protein